MCKEDKDLSLLPRYTKIKQAIVGRVENGLTVEKAAISYLKTLIKEKDDDQISLMIRFGTLAKGYKKSEKAQLVIKEISNQILNLAAEYFASIGPSNQSREGMRTPIEVLINFLARLEEMEGKEISGITNEVKSMILSHKISISDVNLYLIQLLNDHKDHKQLMSLIQELRKSLIKKFIPTRFHDNIYGRAFETSFISSLVNDPPKDVCQAISLFSRKMAIHLKKLDHQPKKKKAFANHMISYMRGDSRFWFPQVPIMKELTKKNIDTTKILIDFLEAPKITGFDCIAVPFLTVTISQALRKSDAEPDWLKRSTKFYHNHFTPKTKNLRDDLHRMSTKEEESGIKLQYQPSIDHHSWMHSTYRQALKRRPNFSVSRKEKSYFPLMNSIKHGIPWVSGISGSTNINLFALSSLDPSGEIDPKAFLLGTIMMLVYEGGHSAHESIWAASQINKVLHLGFDELSSSNSNDYISDYSKFAEMYSGKTYGCISNAFEEGFETIIDQFNQNSYYA